MNFLIEFVVIALRLLTSHIIIIIIILGIDLIIFSALLQSTKTKIELQKKRENSNILVEDNLNVKKDLELQLDKIFKEQQIKRKNLETTKFLEENVQKCNISLETLKNINSENSEKENKIFDIINKFPIFILCAYKLQYEKLPLFKTKEDA